MNASNPISLIAPVGNGSSSTPLRASGTLAQAGEGGEAVFVESLSAVLSSPIALPVTPAGDPSVSGFGVFAAPLTDGTVTDKGNLLLGEGVSDVVPSSLLGDTKSRGAEGLAGSPVTTLNRLAEREPSSSQTPPPGNLRESGAQARTGLAEGLLHQPSSSAAALASLSQPGEQGSSAAGLPGERLIPTALASQVETSSPSVVAHQHASTTPRDGQTSTIAVTAATRLKPGEPQFSDERNLTQQRPGSFARPATGETDSDLVLRSVQGRPADVAKDMVHADVRPPPDQGTKTPVLHPSFVQQVQGQMTTDDAPLLPVKAKGQAVATPAVNGTPVSAARPSDLISASNVNLIEAETIDGAARPGTSAEAFLTETGGLDPVGGVSSKSAVQSAQPSSTQIAMHIARAIPQGIDRFSIQLHPAELGMVEIRLDFAEEGRVSALITAERPETLEMLQRDSRSIERTLNNAGLSLDNGGLSFSLKQDQQQQQGQGFNAPSQQNSRAFPGDYGRNGGGDDQLEHQPISVSRQRLLDIRT